MIRIDKDNRRQLIACYSDILGLDLPIKIHEQEELMRIKNDLRAMEITENPVVLVEKDSLVGRLLLQQVKNELQYDREKLLDVLLIHALNNGEIVGGDIYQLESLSYQVQRNLTDDVLNELLLGKRGDNKNVIYLSELEKNSDKIR